jgi:hypothetical protein
MKRLRVIALAFQCHGCGSERGVNDHPVRKAGQDGRKHSVAVRYWLLETSNMRIFSDAMSKFARDAEWPNRLFASKMAPPTNK